MRRFLALVIATVLPFTAQSQAADVSQPATGATGDWNVTLTVFRSPGTGIQVAKGRLAAFVAHYPTVIERDGEQRNTQFIRIGVAAYARPKAGTSPYASLSLAPSLTAGWPNSGLADVGLRRRFGGRFSGQLGVAVLYAPETKESRVNPTVGLGVRF